MKSIPIVGLCFNIQIYVLIAVEDVVDEAIDD